ncbi:2OG-Fe(II) oxygenase [Prochlorococcus sp. MIT 1341]|uniref:2OG-Fe(II) oxygenase n=1 Tax=Prochlorococcus sp. MIT 1341 TaxID=3096221 RepID=UPI002A758272|nr:2OG-Fe(II) oxygenase [Prochlorococcus sp. MIT 1341]
MHEIITKENHLIEPFTRTNPFPLVVYDDFIHKDYCDQLIQEANEIIKETIKNVHGGRLMLPWKSALFNALTTKSATWRNFEELMPKNALEIFSSIVGMELNQATKYKKWLKGKSINIHNDLYNISSGLIPSHRIKSYKKSLELDCKSLPNNRLLIYGLIGILDSLYRNIFGTIDFFKGTINLTPLFDYSNANSGYTREIHRDSDSRVFVLLLYLNYLEDSTEGGTLDVYEPLQSLSKYPPQIPQSKAKKILEIHPRPGRLVIFFNQSNSYHAVSKMSRSKIGRHFIYGGYTMQNSLGAPAIKSSTNKLPTEYFLYK